MLTQDVTGMQEDRMAQDLHGRAPSSAPAASAEVLQLLMQQATELHREGRLDAAQTLYRLVLQRQPGHADANHNLGTIALGRRELRAALAFFEAARAAQPGRWQYWISLLDALTQDGACWTAARVLDDAWRMGMPADAVDELLERLLDAAQAAPGEQQTPAPGNPPGAVAQDRADDPDHVNLQALARAEQGRLVEAEFGFRRAIALAPRHVAAHSNLGMALHRRGQLDRAAQVLRHCIELDDGFHLAHFNLGVVQDELGLAREAEASVRRALQIRPDFVAAHNSLGYLLKDQGRLGEAQASIRRALELDPQDAAAHSNLLFVLNYDPDKTARQIFQAYAEFDARLGLPLRAHWRAHANSRATGRRLKVGYVVPALNGHSTRYFLEPLLAHHDHARFEVVAYTELHGAQSGAAASYRTYFDGWVSTAGMSDDALAQRIRADRIDVLVDIAGHTRGNRLGVFARKPAPVSLHWLDFGASTGLSAIDYYLTDGATVPVGSEDLFSETPWRLPVPAFAYRPDPAMGAVGPLPAQQRGHVTFGTLTRAIRINHRTIRVWAAILHRVSGARLVIDSGNFSSEAAREALAERFAAHGIARDRLAIGCHSPPWDVLRTLDIGLDCFPHNSGTTLLEMLAMGVPFVTLAGRPSVGRLGSAILQGVGRAQWIAQSEQEYVDTAVALALDLPALTQVRQGLRAQLQASAVMDEAGFAGHVEAAYAAMFARWSASQAAVLPQEADVASAAVDALVQRAVQQNMALALVQHRAGALDRAEDLYRAILAVTPDHADANHNLAVIALETGHAAASLKYFRAALQSEPANWQYWLSCFDALLQAGACDEAVQALERRRRLGMNPAVLDELVARAVDAVWRELGALGRAAATGPASVPQMEIGHLEDLFSQGRLDEVVGLARGIIERHPRASFGWKALGAALVNLGEVGAAMDPLRTAVELAPGDAGARSNFGFSLQSQCRPVQAEVNLRVALRIRPDFPSALINLGATLLGQRRYDEAGALFRRGLAAEPGYFPAHNHLGQVLDEQGRLIESVACYRKTLEILAGAAGSGRAVQIHRAQAHQSLCMNYAKLADYDEVIAQADAAMQALPDDADLWERRLYAFSYHPELPVDDIFAQFVRWGDRFPAPATDFSAHDRTPARRLRVGYVSPDFRRHTSRFYFWPLFANHDPARVELFAYANVRLDDDFTEKFKTVFHHWCDIREMSDAQAAARIQADGIDILVDGCNHMRDERLGIFALKPAPVQATWLGAAWTTGLKAVDYVLFDRFIAPPETIARENIVRLPHCFASFEALTQTDAPGPPPCLANGFVTFGYSGRSERLNHRVFRVWGEILRRLPTARLVLDFMNFSDPLNQAHFRGLMRRHGLDTDRVVMRNSSNIFQGLHDFDILLDSFPHSGGTMLVDALWMGVPTLTLAGRPPLGRIGTTFMMNLELPHWVAWSEQEYADKACAFASDAQELARLRAGMRERMQGSPFMDGKAFARGVEWAFDAMWTRYCAGEAPSPISVPPAPGGAP